MPAVAAELTGSKIWVMFKNQCIGFFCFIFEFLDKICQGIICYAMSKLFLQFLAIQAFDSHYGIVLGKLAGQLPLEIAALVLQFFILSQQVLLGSLIVIGTWVFMGKRVCCFLNGSQAILQELWFRNPISIGSAKKILHAVVQSYDLSFAKRDKLFGDLAGEVDVEVAQGAAFYSNGLGVAG